MIEKLYFREPHWTHFIRVNAMSTIHHQVQKVVKKMTIIHENYGHPPATVMIQMCDKYDAGLLGFTKSEDQMVQENQTVTISTVNQHKADSQRMTNKDQREAEDQHKVDKSQHKDVDDQFQQRLMKILAFLQVLCIVIEWRQT